MRVIETAREVRGVSRAVRRAGRKVGLVPTMGYLHDGHLALIRIARQRADHVVVSVYVNPTQFGPGEDLERYPQNLPRDLELCRQEGVDCIFTPTTAEMYPQGFQTFVHVGHVAEPLCGEFRPGHFRGVATVVLKLFHAVEPDLAVFGEKDYQQLQVIRRMVRDLDLGLEIVGAPTVRESDGLAMSSRNAYLSEAGRRRAGAVPRSLARAQELVAAGENRTRVILNAVREVLEQAGVGIQYAELVDPETLVRVDALGRQTLLALACHVDGTRLIDNRVLTAK